MASHGLIRLYSELESTYRPLSDPDYERLVVASDAIEEPVHRWFRMKEAFSPFLLGRVLKETGISDLPSLHVLDPFAGSGTTLVSALEWNVDSDRHVHAAGYEVNPFLYLLASAKTRVLSLSSSERYELARHLETKAVQCLGYDGPPHPTPKLTAFSNNAYFSPNALTELLRIKAAITDVASEPLVVDLLSVALGAAIEPASQLRRDGRALRYVPDRPIREPRQFFAKKVRQIAVDIRMSETLGSASIQNLDGRSLEGSRAAQVDVAVFSPPYPNNIDYTEVYKLEAWLLGLISDPEQFRQVRRGTMRSHPSVSWKQRPSASASDVDDLIRPVLSALPVDRYLSDRQQVFKGYLEDSAQLFKNLALSLKSGGFAVFVVGNSRHGAGADSVTFAADLLLARLAETAGFDVYSFKEARRLHRRGSDALLRESVVILRLP